MTLVVWTGACAAPARGQPPIFAAEAIAYGKAPIDYYGPDEDNAVADLAHDLQQGKRQLAFDGQHGYLPALLQALQISVESQVLVFSKSSLNQQLISPKNPRAIYFNDDVYVAFVPGAASIEISAIDRRKGALFYTLEQTDREQPRFRREERCVVCHASQSTLDVPGNMLRSFETTETGKLVSGHSRITHDTPYAQRWGGWYATGKHGTLIHQGNLIGPADFARHRREPGFRGNLPNLNDRLDTSRYLSAHSDIAALLVLDHQVHFQNLCIRLSMETQLGHDAGPTVEQLVRYLLFADAPPLEHAVAGSTNFAQWFESQRREPGAIEPAADLASSANLRKLNLKDRIFEHSVSYMIHSTVFESLPSPAKQAVYRRLEAVLGTDPPQWLKWTAAQRHQTRRLLLKAIPSAGGRSDP